MIAVGQGDVAWAGTARTRTAPYDDGSAWTGCGPETCDASATASKVTGALKAAAGAKSAPLEQQLLWPGSYRYWSGHGVAALSADMAAGPGKTTWTARLHVNSAVVNAAASSGSAQTSLVVGFGVINAAKPYAGTVAGKSITVMPMSNKSITLRFPLSLRAAGVYKAFVVIDASALVSNDALVATPSVPLPCLISRYLGRHPICVPPSVASRTVYGFADGQATSSIDARLNSITVASS